MATNFFGLNIVRKLAEVSDKEESLKSLGVDIADLDKIRGISTAGVQKTDLQTLSNLYFDAEKVTYSLNSETSLYELLTSDVYDKYSFINSNLNINGSLAASSFKYKFVDFNANPVVTKSADVSTSRVSSWSTFEVVPDNVNSSPIFYGGDVSVEGPIELSTLTLTNTFEQKRFNSQVPTHKIKVNVGGETLYLYAMRGIPIVLNGDWRAINLSITTFDPALRASWVVKDATTSATLTTLRDNNNLALTYSTLGTRLIELYYPPRKIQNFSISRMGLNSFPNILLANTVLIDTSFNNLREFPDLSKFTQLTTLNVSHNNLTRASNNQLRTLNTQVVARMPNSLRSLTMGNVFGGNITGDLSAFPLANLDFSCASTADRRYTGNSPNVNTATIESYNININLFSGISSTLFTAPLLKSLNIGNNRINQNNLNFTSPELLDFYMGYNSGSVNLVNVSNKQKLTSYVGHNTTYRNDNPTYPNNIQNIFNGCSALVNVDLENTNVAGNFPLLTGCSALKTLNLRNTKITRFNDSFFLSPVSFLSCKGVLESIYIQSDQMKAGISNDLTIEPDTFKGMFNLRNLFINTVRKDSSGLTGAITSAMVSDLNSLSSIQINNSNINEIPIFNNSPNLVSIHFARNNLGGEGSTVPDFGIKPRMTYLNLDNNSYRNLGNMSSSALQFLSIANNGLLGSIPNFSNLTALTQLYLNGNQLSSYTTGSFSPLVNLAVLDLSNNNLNQGAVNSILKDLLTNYNTRRRSGVSVLLSGTNNSAPSTDLREYRDLINTLTTAGWRISLSRNVIV